MSQSFVQIKASTVEWLRKDLKSTRICPSELKDCSEATYAAGIAMTSTAIRENRANFSWFGIHHSSIERSAWRGLVGSSWYISSSAFFASSWYFETLSEIVRILLAHLR